MDVREKLEVIANLGDHISYKEDIGICYDSALAKVIEDAYMTLKNGVTVQEWKPISEPPKEKGTYLVCTDNGGVLLGHWYGTAWNAGGGANKHLAYWTEKPQPPKGE